MFVINNGQTDPTTTVVQILWDKKKGINLLHKDHPWPATSFSSHLPWGTPRFLLPRPSYHRPRHIPSQSLLHNHPCGTLYFLQGPQGTQLGQLDQRCLCTIWLKQCFWSLCCYLSPCKLIQNNMHPPLHPEPIRKNISDKIYRHFPRHCANGGPQVKEIYFDQSYSLILAAPTQ